jgi:hypothetical protein
MNAPSSQPDKTKVDKFGVSKKVHYVLMANMIPALTLCISHGASTSRLVPALGLIPAGLGAILAVYRSGVIRRFKKSPEHEYQILLSNDGEEGRQRLFCLESISLAIADFLFMSGLVITIVFSWLQSYIRCWSSRSTYKETRYSYRWCSATGLPMLAAYGTFPLIIAA